MAKMNSRSLYQLKWQKESLVKVQNAWSTEEDIQNSCTVFIYRIKRTLGSDRAVWRKDDGQNKNGDS